MLRVTILSIYMLLDIRFDGKIYSIAWDEFVKIVWIGLGWSQQWVQHMGKVIIVML